MNDFRMLRVFNDESVRGYAKVKARLGANSLRYFEGDSLAELAIRAGGVERIGTNSFVGGRPSR